MSESSDDDASGAASTSGLRGRMTSADRSSAVTLSLPRSNGSSTSTLSLSASNVVSVIGGGGRQKSLFGGMGRVRLREKWGAKPKAAAMAAATAAAAAVDADAALRKAKKKLHAAPNAPAASVGSSESESERESDRRRRRGLSAVDMARYRTLFVWLEQNGIAVPPPQPLALRRQATPTPVAAAAVTRTDPFDDVYETLETLERAVERELSTLCPPPSPSKGVVGPGADDCTPNATGALLDYVVVIGPDVADMVIQNYWHGNENMFEATVAFAWPPASQFNAESIEHFCFPSGVVATVLPSPER